jgi:hypothetical protein
MAKVTPGPLAGVVSGKVGNVVFSRGRYGAYIRVRTIPTKVISAYTTDVRGRLSQLSQNWSDLDAAERDAWRTWAATNPVIDRLGNAVTLQPSAAFIQLNARILQAGGTQIDVPPVGGAPSSPLTASITASVGGGTVSVVWTPTPLTAGLHPVFWCAVLDGGARKYYRNLLKLVHVGPQEGESPHDIATELENRFGVLILGQKIYLELEVWSRTTGLRSGRIAASCEVSA